MHDRISVKTGFMMRSMRVLGVAALFLGALTLYAENETPVPTVLVGDVTLKVERQNSEQERLDVGLAVFDPGIPIDRSSHSKLGIFPEIRKAESKFMPVLLRQALVASNAWGVVRVLPDAQMTTELLVTGVIKHSDGSRLELNITAVDATGLVWFDRLYRDQTNSSDYPAAEDRDPYDDMYRQIANDLLNYREGLTERQLQAIRQTAFLRYAASLSEDAFGGYLQKNEQGIYSVVRLPAQGDPMTRRVEGLREQEHLFVDTVDEQYVDLFDEMLVTYSLWREYSRDQALYLDDYEARAQTKERAGRRGTFAAMEQTYNTYKQVKIQEQDLDEMATGFNNEVAPTVMEASGRVFRLNGSLDAQYQEWRDILREIFALETGLPSSN
ncbi:MAG: hypothetical protein AAF699_02735 [Pseudomonadota bacterium]